LHDSVIVERAGDVIPYVVKPVAENRPGNCGKPGKNGNLRLLMKKDFYN